MVGSTDNYTAVFRKLHAFTAQVPPEAQPLSLRPNHNRTDAGSAGPEMARECDRPGSQYSQIVCGTMPVSRKPHPAVGSLQPGHALGFSNVQGQGCGGSLPVEEFAQRE